MGSEVIIRPRSKVAWYGPGSWKTEHRESRSNFTRKGPGLLRDRPRCDDRHTAIHTVSSLLSEPHGEGMHPLSHPHPAPQEGDVTWHSSPQLTRNSHDRRGGRMFMALSPFQGHRCQGHGRCVLPVAFLPPHTHTLQREEGGDSDGHGTPAVNRPLALSQMRAGALLPAETHSCWNTRLFHRALTV